MRLILTLLIILTGCYHNKEYKAWDKNAKMHLDDKPFYEVFKSKCPTDSTKIKLDHPYISTDAYGTYHAYTFDREKVVYSYPFQNGKPDIKSILIHQRKIGYYGICGDTLTIEEISSLSLNGCPWKFIHVKTLGLVNGDTLKISPHSIKMKEKNVIPKILDVYLPFGTYK
jgi:hypothetical protein